MCYNPRFLLAKTVFYKGYARKILYWKTLMEDYERGYVDVKFSDLNSKTLHQCLKYGLVSYTINGDFEVRGERLRFDERVELPCRKCLECTSSRAREWSIRCQLESEQFTDNYFVTLTYNDNNIKFNKVWSFESDLPKYVPTLVKEDTFKFMKSLRQNFKRCKNHDGIRFFMCGEYGEKRYRPHYHYILFNLPLDDLEFIGNSKTGIPLYRSRFLERSWNKGFVTVQKFSIECARYVAQYCTKKLNKCDNLKQGRDDEFINMSRMPGIGSNWFFNNCSKLYCVNEYTVNPKITRSSCSKGNDYKVNTFGIPKAFERYFEPITDIKRNIDTEHGALRGLVCDDGSLAYDNYQFKKINNFCNAQKKDFVRFKNYGFDEQERYSAVYLDYLKILESEFRHKFIPTRNLC